MTPIEEIKAMAARLRELFPNGLVTLQTSFPDSLTMPMVELNYHGVQTYDSATEWMRSMGVHKREKAPYTTYTYLKGSVDGVQICTYPNELPPTCRVEKYIEKVPKTQVVTTDEFVEIERTRVVCGNDE